MTNNETHTAQREAWERGYREALLNVYLFLTGNELALDLEPHRFDLIEAMAYQITAHSQGRLEAVA